MKKKSIIVIAALFCIFANTANAQEKWQLRLSYGLVQDNSKMPLGYSNNNTSHFRIDVDREIINHLRAGIYVGYSQLGIMDFDWGTFTPIDRTATNALFYGLNFRYQMMPLFTGQKDNRFEFYPIISVGFVSEFWRVDNSSTITDESGATFFEISPHNLYGGMTNFEFGFGLGVAYSITRRLSVFGEGTYGKFRSHEGFRFHVGVRYNF